MSESDGVRAFVEKTRALLAIEHEEEVDRAVDLRERLSNDELEARGVCIAALRLEERTTGLFGRTLLKLVPSPMLHGGAHRERALELPNTQISAGDTVLVCDARRRAAACISAGFPRGIVHRVTRRAITIALDHGDESAAGGAASSSADPAAVLHSCSERIAVHRLADDVTQKRLTKALRSLEEQSSPIFAPIRQLLFTPGADVHTVRDARGAADSSGADLTAACSNLNDPQRQAVAACLRTVPLAMIHGPPGTGKTTTVCSLIREFVHRKMRVLACAPSNTAADNLVERLAPHAALPGPSSRRADFRLIRVGHPARTAASTLAFTLDAAVESSDQAALCKDIRREMDKAAGQRDELRALRRELRERERASVSESIRGADVVVSTLAAAGSNLIERAVAERPFDVVVVDEAAQATAALTWIALRHASRCILAGDHFQLPPTILSEQAAREGLQDTLFAKAMHKLPNAGTLLEIQYRMHEHIMQWSSREFYACRLRAAPSVAAHTLRDIARGPTTTPARNATSLDGLLDTPLHFVDTAGCDMCETEDETSGSKANAAEVYVVAAVVSQLRALGVSSDALGVIAPYSAQVSLLRAHLDESIDIGTVDSFQGREKEAIIISAVRSNAQGNIGFLAEERRMNVAVTRARRLCVLVGDSDTLRRSAFLTRLVKHFEARGAVHTAAVFDGDSLRSFEAQNALAPSEATEARPTSDTAAAKHHHARAASQPSECRQGNAPLSAAERRRLRRDRKAAVAAEQEPQDVSLSENSLSEETCASTTAPMHNEERNSEHAGSMQSVAAEAGQEKDVFETDRQRQGNDADMGTHAVGELAKDQAPCAAMPAHRVNPATPQEQKGSSDTKKKKQKKKKGGKTASQVAPGSSTASGRGQAAAASRNAKRDSGAYWDQLGAGTRLAGDAGSAATTKPRPPNPSTKAKGNPDDEDIDAILQELGIPANDATSLKGPLRDRLRPTGPPSLSSRQETRHKVLQGALRKKIEGAETSRQRRKPQTSDNQAGARSRR